MATTVETQTAGDPIPGATAGLDVDRFVARKQKDWRELSALLDRFEAQGGRGLSLAEARNLGRLYRAACADLLIAKNELVDAALADYLDGLVGRAYACVYAADNRAQFALGDFLWREFPALVRAEARLIFLSLGLMLAGALFGAAVMVLDPSALGIVIPDMHQEQTPEERVREEAHGGKHDVSNSAVFSSFLFTHNIQVTFLVFALGVTFGLGTAFVLFWNGVPLGALAAQYHLSGQALFFWAWILPHGVVELTVVFIAGASGFVLARGLVRPGQMTRRRALSREAKRAVRLVLGGMPMLVVAGLVEGTISQMHAPRMPYGVKLAFAAALFMAMLAYLLRGRTLSVPAAESSARAAG